MERAIDMVPISISQALVTKAASDLGLWGNNKESSPEKRLIADEATYRVLLDRWVKRVRSDFESEADLTREPVIYAVLYRLGQLGGDYEMARVIAKMLLECGDLRRFMRSTQLAGQFEVTYGHLDIVWDVDHLLEIIERDPKNLERYEKARNLLRSAEARDYFKRRSTKPTNKLPPG